MSFAVSGSCSSFGILDCSEFWDPSFFFSAPPFGSYSTRNGKYWNPLSWRGLLSWARESFSKQFSQVTKFSSPSTSLGTNPRRWESCEIFAIPFEHTNNRERFSSRKQT